MSWDAIDTVLLDMDGTLLDLAYDNTLWTTLLPERFSSAQQITLNDARERLFAHMGERQGRLEFYCLDYWAAYTGLDILALHEELTHLIAFRPHAEAFLDHLRSLQRRSLLVTNAHRGSLGVKIRHADLDRRLHALVSCHDYGAPKESQTFWESLMAEHPFDPDRTLLIDDNAAVLDAADRFGIAHLLTVAQPDSGRPARSDLRHRAVEDFRDLMDASTAERAAR
ncbi:MAG TPA: GMP/IMP nucleotidase [Pseudomonadales bacterium]